MALQTNYPDIQPAAIKGAQATMLPATIISRDVETSPGIGFGRAVAQGTADKGIVLAGTGATKLVGITLLDRSAVGSAGVVTGSKSPTKASTSTTPTAFLPWSLECCCNG